MFKQFFYLLNTVINYNFFVSIVIDRLYIYLNECWSLSLRARLHTTPLVFALFDYLFKQNKVYHLLYVLI
jgi:hypothetical protein